MEFIFGLPVLEFRVMFTMKPMDSMDTVQCVTHNIEFKIPVTEKEYISGEFHHVVINLEKHIEMKKDCKFVYCNILTNKIKC